MTSVEDRLGAREVERRLGASRPWQVRQTLELLARPRMVGIGRRPRRQPREDLPPALADDGRQPRRVDPFAETVETVRLADRLAQIRSDLPDPDAVAYERRVAGLESQRHLAADRPQAAGELADPPFARVVADDTPAGSGPSSVPPAHHPPAIPVPRSNASPYDALLSGISTHDAAMTTLLQFARTAAAKEFVARLAEPAYPEPMPVLPMPSTKTPKEALRQPPITQHRHSSRLAPTQYVSGRFTPPSPPCSRAAAPTSRSRRAPIQTPTNVLVPTPARRPQKPPAMPRRTRAFHNGHGVSCAPDPLRRTPFHLLIPHCLPHPRRRHT